MSSKVRDWEGVERLWEHTFKKEFRVTTEERTVLTETPSNLKVERKRALKKKTTLSVY